MIQKAGSEKKATLYMPRRAYAVKLLEEELQPVAIQALLGHERIASRLFYSHAEQERLPQMVADI